MATIPKRTKGAPPPENKPSNNLTKKAATEKAYLNFTTTAAFKKAFKRYALEHDLPMNRLLEACFDAYKESRD